MKRIVMISMVIALNAALLTSGHARDRSVEGLIIGGGTGAIVGQAIGHNAQSTIIGATVGGTVGLIIGSGIDSHYQDIRYRGHRGFAYSGPRYNPYRPRVYRKTVHHYDHRRPVYGHGYTKKKKHRKSRPVFSNHYGKNRRDQIKHSRKNRHHNRF